MVLNCSHFSTMSGSPHRKGSTTQLLLNSFTVAILTISRMIYEHIKFCFIPTHVQTVAKWQQLIYYQYEWNHYSRSTQPLQDQSAAAEEFKATFCSLYDSYQTSCPWRSTCTASECTGFKRSGLNVQGLWLVSDDVEDLTCHFGSPQHTLPSFEL